MACEILLHLNETYSHPDPDKNESGVYKKGHPVVVKDYPNEGWGRLEVYPYFVRVIITDVDKEGVLDYLKEWKRVVDWDIVNNNLSIDGWRLRLYMTNPNVSNYKSITKDMIESYLNSWGASVYSFGTNEVIFDVIVDDMIRTTTFWSLPVMPPGISLIETNYIQATGSHSYSVDYSNIVYYHDEEEQDPWTFEEISTYLLKKINNRPVSNVVHDSENKTIAFDITRSVMLDVFKGEIKEILEVTLSRRQFKVNNTAMNTLINYMANNDGEPPQITKAQLVSYLQNRLDD